MADAPARSSAGTAPVADRVLEIHKWYVRHGWIVSLEDDAGAPAGTRTRLLEAAITLTAEEGFAACTLRAIGEHVGLKAPGVYHHFSSKEALLGEASAYALRRFFSSVVGPLDKDPAALRLERLIMRWVRFQIEERRIAQANDTLFAAGVLKRVLNAEDWERIASPARAILEVASVLLDEAGARDDVERHVVLRAVTAVCNSVGLACDRRDQADDVAEQAWLLIKSMVQA